jgi:hypothetical protein
MTARRTIVAVRAFPGEDAELVGDSVVCDD